MDIDTTDPAVRRIRTPAGDPARSEEHTSELQSRLHLVCRLLLEKKKKKTIRAHVPQYERARERTRPTASRRDYLSPLPQRQPRASDLCLSASNLDYGYHTTACDR